MVCNDDQTDHIPGKQLDQKNQMKKVDGHDQVTNRSVVLNQDHKHHIYWPQNESLQEDDCNTPKILELFQKNSQFPLQTFSKATVPASIKSTRFNRNMSTAFIFLDVANLAIEIVMKYVYTKRADNNILSISSTWWPYT